MPTQHPISNRPYVPSDLNRRARNITFGLRRPRSALLMVLLLLVGLLPSAVHARPGDGLKLVDGTAVPVGQLEAVGTIPGCTATLIGDSLILTAAHCVCPSQNNAVGCRTRTTFTLHAVFPTDDPRTRVNESRQRTQVSINGTVRVHPEYTVRGWLREDIAVVQLDQPVSRVTVGVQPLRVEEPENTPLAGDALTLVGFGATGADCKGPLLGKQRRTLRADISEWSRIAFERRGACPGDSGGPLLNTAGGIVGVTSWGGQGATYRPTSYSYNWIFGLLSTGWGACAWIGVEQRGINSHAAGPPWIPDGSFLVALDLDSDGSISAHDSPVIGQVLYCKLAGAETAGWGSSSWYQVGQRGISSDGPGSARCPNGSYITQIDLDANNSADAHNSPVLGQVRCSTLKGAQYARWGSSYWRDLATEGINSHQRGEAWCVSGAFLTEIDLDTVAAFNSHDSPVVGQVKCSQPRP